jgi:sporulation protein YlmC with PRC-barrel domain
MSKEGSTRPEIAGVVAAMTILFLFLCPAAIGAEKVTAGEKGTPGQPRVAGTQPKEHQIPASELIGTSVKNQKDEVVGEVNDIIIVNDNGQIPYVVVAFGKTFDFTADELFAIPFTALKHEHEKGVCVLNVDMVKELPGDKDKPDWLEVSEDETSVQTEESPLGDFWVEPPAEGDAKVEHRSKALSAKAILGADILNKAGEEVGKLYELIVDLDKGGVVNTVFVAGGTFGVGGEHYLLPWKFLTHSREEGKLIANVDKQMLESMPRYEGEDKPASAPPAPGS